MDLYGSVSVLVLCFTIVRAQKAGEICVQPELRNGEFRYWYMFPLSTFREIEYTCDVNYVPLNGSSEYGIARCTENGWDPKPRCIGKPCGSAPVVENANTIKVKINYLDGESATYECKTDYVVVEHNKANCQDGQWIDIPKCVSTFCASPPIINNGRIISENYNYRHSEKALYECNSGYIFWKKSDYALCEGGHWIQVPVCRKKEDKCGAAIEVKNGEVRKLPLFFSHKIPTAVYSCQENYVLDGKHRIECRNGEWEDPPVCMQPCTFSPEQMKENNIGFTEESSNSFLEITRFRRIIKHGEYTDFKCLSGYEIFDERLLRVKCVGGILLYPTCTLQGQWKSCGNPPAILYGDTLQPLMKRNPHGTVMDYICPEYYVLEGNPKVKCRDGKWEEPPVCMDPCTVTAHIMKTNNIKLKWVSHDKIYIPHGEGVEFSCLDGYELSDGNLLRVTCNRGILSYPICTKPGQREGCGSPPVILNGDTVQKPSSFHAHGAVLEYKCINYYVLEGKNRITCKDGKWDNVPACIDPCTVTAHIMKTNNIKLKWVSRDILFIPHGEDVEFSCLDGYELSDGNLLRVTCNRGILSYPVCTKPEQCTILKEDLNANNVRLKWISLDNLYIKHGDSMEFSCLDGYDISDRNLLRVKCDTGIFSYPKCTKQVSCGPPPVVLNGDTIQERLSSYTHGTVMDYKCTEYHVLEGNYRITCRDGKWDNPPVCVEPCAVKGDNLKANNIILRWLTQDTLYTKHGDYVEFACLEGYEISDKSLLRKMCNRGVFSYPTCTKPGEKQGCGPPPLILHGDIIQQRLRIYTHGSIVDYKCPEYYVLEGNYRISCADGKWDDPPVCIEPCTITRSHLKDNNIVLKWLSQEKLYVKHGDYVEFTCLDGYVISEKNLLRGRCNKGDFTYPKCK